MVTIRRWGLAAILFLAAQAHGQHTNVGRAGFRDIGTSGNGVVIHAIAVEARPGSPTVLVVGGISGGSGDASVREAARLIRLQQDTPPGERTARLLAIPVANPDDASLVFPPEGTAYRENPESHALWRWIGTAAPDLVLILGDDDGGLAVALSGNAVAGIGAIPARAVPIGEVQAADWSLPVPDRPSEAATEIAGRRGRTAEDLAGELSVVYGQDFDQLTYLPGMALVGRMRLGDVEAVDRLARPYIGRDNLARASSLTLAGHLVFAELAERTGNPDYLGLVRMAADLGFDESGNMLESMPFHGDMSDSFFMAGPLLAKAGKLTGEDRYFDMAARHVEYMRGLDLRPDGLYRHSPLSEAAWSRGNAFPALGIALMLSEFPEDHPETQRIAGFFRDHMEAILDYQNADGMWRNVIDIEGAFAEYSSTAMIATAMIRGVERGWLDAEVYEPPIDAAWDAILVRTGSDGTLVDVCESTNKQETLDDYLARGAILGTDVRGGGMALIFATEMMARGERQP
jgi:rhamnogalacturonyl hydrolase YesR